LLAENDLAAGRLVALSQLSLALGHPYSMVYPQTKARKTGLTRLIQFLKADLREE
jgi:LysR family glycine cleavage system transcriptional activator